MSYRAFLDHSQAVSLRMMTCLSVLVSLLTLMCNTVMVSTDDGSSQFRQSCTTGDLETVLQGLQHTVECL